MIVFIAKLQQTADENLFCVHKYGNELRNIHTLRVHYAHAAANLNSGYSKYAK